MAVVSSVLCGDFIKADTASAKVVCYYDGRSFTREGKAMLLSTIRYKWI